MTGNMGRKKRVSCYVVTGNQNGLAGFSSATTGEMKSCFSTARNKAGQRLIYFPKYENHTSKIFYHITCTYS